MRIRNRLIYRIHDRQIISLASRYFRGRVIDIGCGTRPYAARLAPFVTEHVGVDHALCPHGLAAVDLVGTAYAVPAPSESFDCALCTSVLEHLEEPQQALRECLRLLRPGGVAIYSVPFLWHLHEEPRDFYRFTRHGLAYLFTRAGFEVMEIRALSGFFVTFFTLLGYYLYRFNSGPLRWLRLIDAASLILQLAAAALEHFTRDERYTWMYMVVARKPSCPGAQSEAAQPGAADHSAGAPFHGLGSCAE